MLEEEIQPGDIIRTIRDICYTDGSMVIGEGDRAIYMGGSQIRMLNGIAEDKIFTLTILAPFEKVKKRTILDAQD